MLPARTDRQRNLEREQHQAELGVLQADLELDFRNLDDDPIERLAQGIVQSWQAIAVRRHPREDLLNSRR